MIRVRISRLQAGDILGAGVVNPAKPAETLLGPGVVLSERVVKLFQQVRFRSLWIQHAGSESIAPPLSGSALDAYRRLLGVTAGVFAAARGESIPPKEFELANEQMRQFVAHLITGNQLFVLVDEIHLDRAHPVLFAGAVCHLSILMGLAMHEQIFPGSDTPAARLGDYVILGLAALLHELGMARLRPDLLHKDPWDLTQREVGELASYPTMSYRMLLKPLGEQVADLVLSHRQHLDGSGIEMMSVGTTVAPPSPKEVHPFSRVLCVAHACAEMILRQNYRPLEALEEIHCARNAHFDTMALRALNQVVSPFAYGEAVRLGSGHVGIVSGYNPRYPFRPEVVLFWDKDGSPLPEAQQVVLDLAEHPNAAISHASGRGTLHLVPADPMVGWEGVE